MRSRDRLTLASGLAAVAAGVLGAGGGLRWVVIVVVAFSVVAAASQLGSRRVLDGTSPLLVLLSIAFGLTALQLVPVPDALFAQLHTSAHELITDGERLLGEERAWRPLSLDPPATRLELAKLGAYLLLGWMALRSAAKERGRQRLLVGVAGIAGFVALVAVIHELLGAERLFGIYDPAHANPVMMAPLLNSNHLACLLALGALIAAGLGLYERRAPPVRVMWFLVAAVCVVVVVATRSRGGVMALAGGTTVMAVLMVLQGLRTSRSAKRRDVLRVAIPAAIVVLCTLVLVVALGGSGVRTELENTRLDELSDPTSKYAAWGSALVLVEESPILGVGRGGFQSAFTRVHPASAQLTFSHVENEYLQALIDWGVVGTLAIAVALGFAMLVAGRRWSQGPLAASAIGGLTVVGLQSLVDFGLQLPGLAIPTILVAATLLHVPLREASSARFRLPLRVTVVALVIAAGALGASSLARTLDEDHQRFRASPPSFTEAREAFARHPLDYLSAALIARSAPQPQLRSAFLNHALRLHPGHPGLHRAVAGWLRSTGRLPQAALEYRLALSGSREPEALLPEIVAGFPTVTETAAALPVGHPRWSRIVTWLLDAKREDIAIAYLTNIVSVGGERRAEVWRRLFAIAEKQQDLVATELAARGLLELEPSISGTLALARVQLARANYPGAAATLANLATEPVTSPDHLEARSLVCDIAVARSEWDAARTCLTGLFELPGITLAMRRRTHGRLAKVEDAVGNTPRADLERRLAGEK